MNRLQQEHMPHVSQIYAFHGNIFLGCALLFQTHNLNLQVLRDWLSLHSNLTYTAVNQKLLQQRKAVVGVVL